jgi:glucose-6-phosphate 1-dehydrogenase
LLSLFADNLLPSNLVIYGYARSNITSEDLREKLRPFLDKSGIDSGVINDFLSRCHYQSGVGYGDSNSWKGLNEKIVAFEDDIANSNGVTSANRLFYFAIPPNVFAETGEAIKTSCMAHKGFSRMIVEKPFGKDTKSCKEILARVRFEHIDLFVKTNSLLTFW